MEERVPEGSVSAEQLGRELSEHGQYLLKRIHELKLLLEKTQPAGPPAAATARPCRRINRR